MAAPRGDQPLNGDVRYATCTHAGAAAFVLKFAI
jgi:hypothetical protein